MYTTVYKIGTSSCKPMGTRSGKNLETSGILATSCRDVMATKCQSIKFNRTTFKIQTKLIRITQNDYFGNS